MMTLAKMVSKFFKRNKPDIVLLLLLLAFVYRAWSTLPQLTIRSEGFFYLISGNLQYYWANVPIPITGFEAVGYMLGAIFPKIFGVHLSYYYWLEVFFLLLIAFLFYIFVKILTKNNFVAFAASLIVSSSYFGVYDMVSGHSYSFFFSRITTVPFLMVSITCLHLFLNHRKVKYYLYSLLFYILGIGLGYFNLLFTPLYVFYPVFWELIKKGAFKKRIKGIYYASPYLLLSGLFNSIHLIRDGAVSPHQWIFTEFLLQPEKYLYLKKIALQFVYWSQYPIIFQNLSRDVLNSIIDYRQAGSYIPIVLIVYILAAVTVYKFLPTQRPMLLTIICGIPIIFYLNAYLGQYDMLNFSGASRYLYIQTFLLAIFWSYFLWAVFWRKKNIWVLGGVLILALYYAINVWLIDGNNRLAVGWSKSTRVIFDYVISTREKVFPHTLIVVTYPEFGFHESVFFTEHIGKGEVKYLSENNLVNVRPWEEVASSSARVIRLSYNQKCNCVVEEKIKKSVKIEYD